MGHVASFLVDSQITQLLAWGYRSVERALMELIANGWDADATRVEVTLPEAFEEACIIVRDYGAGMTLLEFEGEYLRVASSRRARRGDRTTRFLRTVKGRKGIGKFAGLMIAESMEVETTANGKTTRVVMRKGDLLRANREFTKLELDIEERDNPNGICGTVVTLTGLSPSFRIPDPTQLRSLLAMEYLRAASFEVVVNGESLTFEDVPGRHSQSQTQIEDVGAITLNVSLSDEAHAASRAGIAIRVDGKVVQGAGYCGLEHDPEVPAHILRRLCGEVNADGLGAGVTADGGGFAEGYVGYERVREWAAPRLKAELQTAFPREFALHRGRLTQEQQRRLERLPEHRREFAQKALEALMRKFYGETPERHEAIQNVVLDAFERGDYYAVVEALDAASSADVARLAEALGNFGLADMAVLGTQAQQRLKFLDHLDELLTNNATREDAMHRAIENNLWVLGPEYALYSSNRTLQTMLGNSLTDRSKKSDRPDLLLSQDVLQRYLLIEFKRPSISIDREHQAQAQAYRDKLLSKFHPIHILMLGAGRATGVLDDPKDCETRGYAHMVSAARGQLNWFLRQLKEGDVSPTLK